MKKKFKINIVLFQPENLGNLANIIRTVYILDCKLHLIKPYGFIGDLKYLSTSKIQKKLNNESKDTINKIKYFEYNSWNDFYQNINFQIDQIIYFTIHANSSLEMAKNSFDLSKNLFCVFGSETFGLSKLPIKNLSPAFYLNHENKKPFNLANAVAIIAYLLQYNMPL